MHKSEICLLFSFFRKTEDLKFRWFCFWNAINLQNYEKDLLCYFPFSNVSFRLLISGILSQHTEPDFKNSLCNMETLILNNLLASLLTLLSIFLFLNAQARVRLLYVTLGACFYWHNSFTFSAAIENPDNTCQSRVNKQFSWFTTTGILPTIRCHFNPRYQIISSQNPEHYDNFLNRNIPA